jgi:phytoene dehydrogenase-like protein
MGRETYDVVIVGSGPNGLSAAIVLARAGLSTLVMEAHDTPGGGARSAALTLPGFVHDPCSAVHPLALASPLFRTLDLERNGLDWVQPPAALAHVLGDGRAVTLERSLDATAAQLGADGDAYRRLLAPFVDDFAALLERVLGPLRLSAALHLARFGLLGLRSMQGLARARFVDSAAGALLGGIAAHAMLPLDAAASAAIALVLGVAGHAVGWPLARGGTQALTDALVARLESLGGELRLEHSVQSLGELPKARAYVLDVAPWQVLRIAGDVLPEGYRQRLQRFRYGPGVYKMDWALSGPVPWSDPACARSSTVHLSGDLDTLGRSEAAVHAGKISASPFTIVVQPSLFDPSRAPPGQHVAWAYCHVPHGAGLDASGLIEQQIERFAPGFRDLILARASRSPRELELYNPNFVGGDINSGLSDLRQLFFRPVARLDPYSTPAPHVFLCSSSTPPGGGVHGMCGYWAAQSVLRRLGKRPEPPDFARSA